VTFRKLLTEKLRLSVKDKLYLLGDYVNKGPDSKGVIDFIFELRNAGFHIHCLRGNHEQYLLDGLNDPADEERFLFRGGKETLESFGVNHIREIPAKYLQFIQALPFYLETEHFLLIHAGLDFSLDDPFADNDSMLNIREMQVDPDRIGGRIVLHGHVPTPVEEIKQSIKQSKAHISIDAGCVYTDQPGLGRLLALDLGSKKTYIQKNID